MTTEGAPLKRLHLFSLSCGLIGASYGLFLLQPAPLMLLGLSCGPPIGVATWMAADTKYTRVANVTDVGWLLYLFLPITIPWYAMRTRGRQGWRLALRLYVLAVAGWLGLVTGTLTNVLVSIVAELAA